MEDYIGARVDYEPKYKDVLTYFQNIGNLYTWEADPWYETCKSWAETCYIHAGISGAEITFQGKDAQVFLSKLCMNNISKWKNGKNKHLVMFDEEVIVKWGDYGKRIKDIRAVIAKFPLNDLVENKNYDISSCPYGFEE